MEGSDEVESKIITIRASTGGRIGTHWFTVVVGRGSNSHDLSPIDFKYNRNFFLSYHFEPFHGNEKWWFIMVMVFQNKYCFPKRKRYCYQKSFPFDFRVDYVWISLKRFLDNDFGSYCYNFHIFIFFTHEKQPKNKSYRNVSVHVYLILQET